jgi:hypothetical protein
MKHKIILCLALGVFIAFRNLFASEPPTNSQPQKLTIWKCINFPFLTNPSNEPIFWVSSGEQYDQVSRGLRLDIMNIMQEFDFFKTNVITARLYRANGEIVGVTPEGKNLLNAPSSTSWSAHLSNGMDALQVMTYFPWSTNALEECWIEVLIGSERYWVEIPYGFDRNPADAPPSSIHAGPPKFVAAMKSPTKHDHVVRWENVEYDLSREGHVELSLKQANLFDAESKVVLYSDASGWRLDSPKTVARILDADGTVRDGFCVNLNLNDNHGRRTDTFQFGRYGDDLRCWGQIEVNVGDKSYRVVVPSSLYKYIHGHASAN